MTSQGEFLAEPRILQTESIRTLFLLTLTLRLKCTSSTTKIRVRLSLCLKNVRRTRFIYRFSVSYLPTISSIYIPFTLFEHGLREPRGPSVIMRIFCSFIIKICILTPICHISGISRSIIFGKKSRKISGDVIHRTFEILLSYLKLARDILLIP